MQQKHDSTAHRLITRIRYGMRISTNLDQLFEKKKKQPDMIFYSNYDNNNGQYSISNSRVFFSFLFLMELKTKCTHRYMNYGTTTCTWIINEGCQHACEVHIFFSLKTIECICTQTSVHEQRTWKGIKKKIKNKREDIENWGIGI